MGWFCGEKALPDPTLILALLLTLLLPKTSYGQKPLILQPEGGVYQLAYSPNSQFLAVSCWKGTVYLWDLAVQKPPHVIAADQSPGRLLGFAPGGKQLVTAAATAQGFAVKRWETVTGKLAGEREIEGWQDGGRFLSISLDCTHVAVSSGKDEKTVLVFDVDAGRKVLSLDLPDMVGAAAFSPQSDILVTAFNRAEKDGERTKMNATVRFTRLKDNRRIEYSVPFLVSSLAYSQDGKTVAAGGGGLKIWDWHREDWEEEFQTRRGHAKHLSLSADGRLVAFTGNGNVWDLRTKKLVLEVKKAFGPLALSPDGKKLAVEVGRELHVYDLPGMAAPKPDGPGQEKR